MNLRSWNKALKEIEESQILVDYLLTYNLDLDDIRNFSEKMVKEAKEWKNRLGKEG